MNEKSQNNKTDNDELRDIVHRSVWGADTICIDLQGNIIKRNILPSRRMGRKYLHKTHRRRVRGLSRRIKNRLTERLAKRLGDQMREQLDHRLAFPKIDFHSRGFIYGQ